MIVLTLEMSNNMELSEGITQQKSNIYDSSNDTQNFTQFESE